MTPSSKVLIVDDKEENLLALGALLRQDGIELLSARSGREALELLLANDFALALLDVQMPEMDGMELAELMRGSERTRYVPIIFVTAGPRDAQRVFRGYEVGAVDFLLKPIDPVLLNHKVRTFVDLHRQRREREQLADELREALRLNEMFVAAVSHDLRSPLSAVLMGATLLDRQITEEKAKRTVSRIRSGAERMAGMLDQLYDLARVRLGSGLTIERVEMDARAATDKVIDEMRVLYPNRPLKAEYAGQLTGHWDGPRLERVIANLVGNALRHGLPEEVVQVRARSDTGTLTVEVHNGGEIPPDVQPHVFDPFGRSSKPARDSLGLGLFIVKEIVEAHGGTIRFTTSKEKGTTFQLRIPAG